MSHLPVMPAGKLLDSRTDLLKRLASSDAFRRQFAFLMASQTGQIPSFTTMEEAAQMNRAEGLVERFLPNCEVAANHLRVGEVYRVSPDMSAMVEFAASQLDDSDAIDLSLPPTQAGLVRFDKPLVVSDIRGKKMYVHWMLWGPIADDKGHSHMGVWAFNDPQSLPDEIHVEMLALAQQESPRHARWYNDMVGRFATISFDFLKEGRSVGPMEAMPSQRQIAEVLKEGFEPLPGTNPVRYVHALWLLLNQTVTKVEDEPVNASARKRAGKARLPEKVTVIRLRREEIAQRREPGESMVEWQHRWIVRGHWRWQRVGEHYAGAVETEKGYRARIWINPFVKGPESAPIRQSEKVYSLDR